MLIDTNILDSFLRTFAVLGHNLGRLVAVCWWPGMVCTLCSVNWNKGKVR